MEDHEGTVSIGGRTNHEGTVSTGGRAIANFRFAYDIDGFAGEKEKLAKLIERLDKAYTAYGMTISAEKTKLITNDTRGIKTRSKKTDRSLRQSQTSST